MLPEQCINLIHGPGGPYGQEFVEPRGTWWREPLAKAGCCEGPPLVLRRAARCPSSRAPSLAKLCSCPAAEELYEPKGRRSACGGRLAQVVKASANT